MFGFFKNMFIGLLSFSTIRNFGESLVPNSERSIKCLSLNNHLCQARPTLVTTNSEETLFYPFVVSINKCGGSCNTINDPYARVYVLNEIKRHECKSISFNIRSK